MAKEKQKTVAAVIDIGSRIIKLVIGQRQGDDFVVLDTLRRSLPLGHESFHQGEISPATTRELCEILSGFRTVLLEYGIEEPKAIGTSALREAKNRTYVLDQIGVKTGLSVEICDESQEKSRLYYELLERVAHHEKIQLEDKRTLLSNLGTGSIGIALYEKGVIRFFRSISMGSLKIHDMLADSRLSSSAFFQEAEEYLDVVFQNILFPKESKQMDALVMTGTEAQLLANLCDAKEEQGVYRIAAEELRALFDAVQKNSLSALSGRYQIDEERAELFYSSLSIFCRLLNLTKAKELWMPCISLTDSYLRQQLCRHWQSRYSAFLEQNTLTTARAYAQQLRCNLDHATRVEQTAVLLFDRLKRAHGFTPKHRILLQVAASLHDVGKIVTDRFRASADFIRNMELCGLSEEEMELCAMLCSFDETEEPQFQPLSFLSLSPEEQLLCSKLTAIFRLANALDTAKKQRIHDLKIRQRGDELVFSCTCTVTPQLEQWAFARCSTYFQNIFGLRPVLRVKSTMVL